MDNNVTNGVYGMNEVKDNTRPELIIAVLEKFESLEYHEILEELDVTNEEIIDQWLHDKINNASNGRLIKMLK